MKILLTPIILFMAIQSYGQDTTHKKRPRPKMMIEEVDVMISGYAGPITKNMHRLNDKKEILHVDTIWSTSKGSYYSGKIIFKP